MAKNKKPTEKPNKATKSKSNAEAKKFEENLPVLAKKYNIRVSAPYGYYPEDVDKVITELENAVNQLEIENKDLEAKRTVAEADVSKAKAELVKMKMEMTLMEQPDTTAEQDFANLGRGTSHFTGKAEPQIMDKPLETKPTMPVGIIGGKAQNEHKVSYNNLIRPKKDDVKPKLKINTNINKGE